ncbi:type I polyketide synthase [Jiella pacifica]|uniref:SDR family NAD(P)-dependent oxidoreductase n=1 Tax=Jiella pacifica TaxID=2696469 RepID=A0A6N9T3R6_9HYPH|nr:type I polyketide synthase [Jiella pacifica]NDW06014.1 SDR family NAD(P)-dependent oxidoreductase [Jiella pacifica]
MTSVPNETGLEIAIVGLDCRFPGAPDPQSYRAALAEGRELVSRFDAETLRARGIPDAIAADPAYVRAQGVLADHDLFDPAPFAINPAEAELMDPQMRVLLECSEAALQNAACVPGPDTPCGVFVGAYYNTYRDIALRAGLMDRDTDAFIANLLNEKDFLATQIAYRLDLVGPAVTVQSACSTSLVAIHLASQALISGECDVALAGGATVRPEQIVGYRFQTGGIYAPDGVTRTFDAAAAGTVPGNGAGVLVLKRLADAIADKSRIRAVIRGTAIGNDGARRIGYTAPAAIGQARIVAAALAASEIDPRTIGYVEAHGSGKPIGDPIEIEGLTRAYGARAAHDRAIGVGSVKTNIGHTHAAAGVAGVIKTIFALEDGWLPPSLNYATPNPRIDFASSPFEVVREGRLWETRDAPRRAGVSSFGMGGTGAHAILEQAPTPAERPDMRSRARLFLLSAASETALGNGAAKLADTFAVADAPRLDDATLTLTLTSGRRERDHRMAVVAETHEQVAAAFAGKAAENVVLGDGSHADGLDFLLPGLGDHRPGMVHGLYRREPVFRDALTRCCTILKEDHGLDLLGPLTEAPSRSSATNEIDLRRMLGRGPKPEDGAGPLADTAAAQPAVFAVEFALAELWRAFGIVADRMLGYSLGEYVAACLAEVMDLKSALSVVALRARAISALPPGAMLAVGSGEDMVRALMPQAVSLAAVNGPNQCVVAGDVAHLSAFAADLSKRGVQSRRVETSHAFHTEALRPAAAPLVRALEKITLSPPKVPYLSNVTGNWITPDEATDPAYWVRHMCEPVRFGDGAAKLLARSGRTVLEIGPGQSTASLFVQSTIAGPHRGSVVSTLPSAYEPRGDHAGFLRAAGRLWCAGFKLDPAAFAEAGARKAALPGYAYDRQRYWLAAGSGGSTAPSSLATRQQGARRNDVADWFTVGGWRSLPHSKGVITSGSNGGERWLVIGSGAGMAEMLEARFAALADGPGAPTACFVPFADLSNHDGAIDVAALALHVADVAPSHVVCLACLDREGLAGEMANLDHARRTGFDLLLALSKVFADRSTDERVEIIVATPGAWHIGDETALPAYAIVLGAARTMRHEQTNICARVVDLLWDIPAGSPERRRIPDHAAVGTADAFLAEIRQPERPDLVALRANRAWGEDHQALRAASPPPKDRHPGVHLVTGGGALGLRLAAHLSATGAAAVVLVVRSGKRGPAHDARAAALEKLRAGPAEVVVEIADVADGPAMAAVAARIMARFGRLDEVFHTAGVAGGGLMQLKDPADAFRVMRPKCEGALVLIEAVRPLKPRTVMLFSSSIALTGAAGQADYAAANLYQDALAAAMDGCDGMRVVSVNWDAWRDIGMAHRNLSGSAEAEEIDDHPLLTRMRQVGSVRVYEAEIRESDWLVDEHRMSSHPVVAGTVHIELIRAAVTHSLTGACGDGRDPIEIAELVFVSPAVVPAGGGLALSVMLTPRAGGGFDVQSASRPLGEADAPLRLHARARAGRTDTPPPAARPIADLLDDVAFRDIGAPEHRGPMGYGPRSHCLRRIHAKDHEAIAEIALPALFSTASDALPLHPSMMDIAAAFVGLHLARRFRIPIAYGALRIYGPLEGTIYSHHRFDTNDAEETTTAAVTIRAADGRALAVIDGFVLKRIDDVGTHMRTLLDGTSREIATIAPPEGARSTPLPLADHLALGIGPEEGMDAIDRLLASTAGSNIAVTTRSLDAIRADLESGAARTPPTKKPAAAKRRLPVPFVPPRSPTEIAVADLWRDVLSLDEVGVHDGFFELGGHSLLGLSLAARLKERLGIEIPLGALFRALTVERLAQIIDGTETTP